MSLLRYGNNLTTATVIDNLTYSYGPSDQHNQLTRVVDSRPNTTGLDQEFKDNGSTTDDYSYDANGNMLKDLNKAIGTASTNGITYNHLNLPNSVTLSGGTINYYYDATGVKQRKVAAGITTDYAGGFQYEGNILKFFPQAEGYVAHNNGVFSYIYQYKDHLGNVRLSYGDSNNDGNINSNTEIIEESNYYPFGLKHKGYNNTTTYGNGNAQGQKYKYNGKELQDELGLNMYDYGARNYDPALGRWINIDPLAEISRRWSPYNYANDNRVFFIDPDGMAVEQFGNNTTYDGVDAKEYAQKLKNQFGSSNNDDDRDTREDRSKLYSEEDQVVSELNDAMHKMGSFESEGEDPKLPEVQKFKNGAKIKGADGKVYQVHNGEWVKLDGVLIDVYSANLGYGSNENAINMPHKPVMVDRAIHLANLKLHFNNVVNGKSIASSAFLEYLVKGTLPKYNFWSTFALGTYNLFDGMFNQYNLNLQHDKTAALFSK